MVLRSAIIGERFSEENPPSLQGGGSSAFGFRKLRRLDAEHEVCGFRCLARGDDDPSFVVGFAENVEPALDAGGSILAVILHDAGLQSEVGGAHLGDRLFLPIHYFPAEAVVLDERLAVEARLVAGGVDPLVEEREVVVLGGREGAEGRA